eukprot:scaffold14.g1274.t1
MLESQRSGPSVASVAGSDSDYSVVASETGPHKKLKWHRRFAHQKLAGYRPVLTATAAKLYFLASAVLCIALGVPILVGSLNVVEVRVPYAFAGPFAGLTSAERQAKLWEAAVRGDGVLSDGSRVVNGSVAYDLMVTIDKEMKPPIYIVFQLGSYFQNYRRYVRSQDATFMHNGDPSKTPASACQPLAYLGDPTTNPGPNTSLYASGSINPCGQTAQSLFNDSFALSATTPGGGAAVPLPIDSSNIAWSNDHKLYGSFIPWNYNSDPQWRGGGTVDQPLDSAQNWMVWMRTGAQVTVEKLYGSLSATLPAGSTLTLRVENRYNTYGFSGDKAVIVTTNSWVGGKNSFLGAFYLALGGACLAVALFFFLAYDLGWIWKRRPGRLADLSWVRNQPDELSRAHSVADLELRFSAAASAAASGASTPPRPASELGTPDVRTTTFQADGKMVENGDADSDATGNRIGAQRRQQQQQQQQQQQASEPQTPTAAAPPAALN